MVYQNIKVKLPLFMFSNFYDLQDFMIPRSKPGKEKEMKIMSQVDKYQARSTANKENGIALTSWADKYISEFEF